MKVLCAVSTAIILLLLTFISFYLIAKGVSYLSWDIFTKVPIPVGMQGAPGGLKNALVGTGILIALASLIGIPLGVLCGYEVCRALKSARGSSMSVMFLSGERTESFDRVAGLLVGADDYLVKPYAADELLVRIRRLDARARPLAAGAREKLTRRESGVLRLLAQGLTQDEIAARLEISPKTVSTHIEHVLQKLGVHSRAQAVALAFREETAELIA